MLLARCGKGFRAHDDGAELGQLAFGELRVLRVHERRHDEPEHRIAEELETLVGCHEAAFGAERPVGEREVEQGVIAETPPERELQACVEIRIGGASGAAGSSGPPGLLRTRAEPSDDVVDRVADRMEIGEVFVVERETDGALPELFLECLHQLDERERVGVEIVA